MRVHKILLMYVVLFVSNSSLIAQCNSTLCCDPLNTAFTSCTSSPNGGLFCTPIDVSFTIPIGFQQKFKQSRVNRNIRELGPATFTGLNPRIKKDR